MKITQREKQTLLLLMEDHLDMTEIYGLTRVEYSNLKNKVEKEEIE